MEKRKHLVIFARHTSTTHRHIITKEPLQNCLHHYSTPLRAQHIIIECEKLTYPKTLKNKKNSSFLKNIVFRVFKTIICTNLK